MTRRIISYSHTWYNLFKTRNQMQRSHSQRETRCMFSPIGLHLFFDQLWFDLLKIKKNFLRLIMGLGQQYGNLLLVTKNPHELFKIECWKT